MANVKCCSDGRRANDRETRRAAKRSNGNSHHEFITVKGSNIRTRSQLTESDAPCKNRRKDVCWRPQL